MNATVPLCCDVIMEQSLRFKPGDKVVVRSDLNRNLLYRTMGGKNTGYGIAPTTYMLQFAGQKFEVKGYSKSQKTLKLKYCSCYWTEEMLQFADFLRMNMFVKAYYEEK